MEKEQYGILKTDFLKIYANIPSPLRTEIAAVIKGEPFSWAACNAEIEHDTEKAPLILEQLKEVDVL
ncbi:hypothetical protein HYU17_03320 [Candidatus Woesearchaeota archaeon]|nr:hypothetical protein [Candidatus Woesearchaeota archaeon]